MRLADIFGDNGMISVVICRPGEPGVWEIDTWLMSCRVLGRKVEHMVLREMLEHARAAGITKLTRCLHSPLNETSWSSTTMQNSGSQRLAKKSPG